jgi:hypothetical protein
MWQNLPPSSFWGIISSGENVKVKDRTAASLSGRNAEAIAAINLSLNHEDTLAALVTYKIDIGHYTLSALPDNNGMKTSHFLHTFIFSTQFF